MSLLNSLTTDDTIAQEKDVLGGGGGLLESGAYPATVTLAYVAAADSGALGLYLTLKTDSGKELRQTLWMSSGRAKGGRNYYEKDGQKFYLPGFLLADSLAQLTTGKPINQLDSEEKVVKLYNFDAKAEVPTKVQVVTDLMGQRIIAAVLKQTVDKNVKDASGAYVASGETREENEIDKFFCARDSHAKMTIAEIRAGVAEASFHDQWVQKNAGVTRNKAKGAAAGGTAGAPAAAAGTAKPTKSLFGA